VLLMLFVMACSQNTQVSSYSNALSEHQKEKPFNPPAEVKKIMDDAAKDLAAKLPEPGLKTGTKAPDFTLTNANGKEVKLSDELKKGPVVLVFYRGAWCPICNIHLRSLQKSLPAFQKQGAQVIAVSPQKPSFSKKQLEDHPLPFEVLSDLDFKVLKAYNLYFDFDPALNGLYKKFGIDVEAYNGEGRLGLPAPATFIIAKDGTIKGGMANIDYMQRMEPAAIIAVLKAL